MHFKRKSIEKLKVNYSQIGEIEILDNTLSITNTFNTFWNSIGGYDNMRSLETAKKLLKTN